MLVQPPVCRSPIAMVPSSTPAFSVQIHLDCYRPAFSNRCFRGLSALKAKSAEDEAKRMGGKKGFYVRPSKAVEMGGGFFVPGLEGPRLRVAIGILAFTLLALNRILLPGYEPVPSQLYSEVITGSTSAFLLGQALFETFSPVVEASTGTQASGDKKPSSKDPLFNPSLSPSQRRRMEWLVGSVRQVAFAEADVLVLGKEGSMVSIQPDADTLAMVESFDPGCVLNSREVDTFTALTDAFGAADTPTLLRRDAPTSGQQVFGLLPDADTAAVLVSGDKSRVLVVGLGGKTELDENEASWLRHLVEMP